MALIDEARRRGLLDSAPAAAPQYGVGLAARAMALTPGYRTGGLIEGPGTETSDSIPAEVPEGTYILPADTTRAAGLASRAFDSAMPVALSDGEFEITPEQLQSIGAAVLDILRGVTHTPVEPEPPVVEEQGYANGGEVTRIGNSYSGGNVGGDVTINGQAPGGTFSQVPSAVAPLAPASVPVTAVSPVAPPPPPVGLAATTTAAPPPAASSSPWLDRNNQRSADVSASSITRNGWMKGGPSAGAAQDYAEPSAPPAEEPPPPIPKITTPTLHPASQWPAPASQMPGSVGAPPRRFANGGLVQDEERRQNLIAQIPAGAPTPFSAAPAVDPGAGPLSRAVSGPNASLAAAGMGAAAPSSPSAATPPAPNSGSLVAAAGFPGSGSAPPPTSAASPSNPLLEAAAQRNSGMISAANEAAATDMSQRQGLAAYAMSQPPQAASVQAPQVPIVRHSGNDWAARNALRNAEVSASSITNRAEWNNAGRADADGKIARYNAAVGNDLALQQAQPGLDLQGMREQGDTQRAGLQVAAHAANAAADRQSAMDRTLITERGNNSRAAITAEGQAIVAAMKARQAAAGKVPEGYRATASGNLEAIPGGPADFKQNKDSQQQGKDTQDIFSILDQARPLLDKSTQSYAGNAADKVAQTFGVATEGAQAAAQLRALEGALVSKMPKMSGPQSDKDVLLYKQMAGQIGDPTIPADQRRAAMGTIEQLNMKYLPAAIDEASYQAVPSGSYYRIPSGEIRRKN